MTDNAATPERDARRVALIGVLAMALACTVWGLSPLYYKLLVHVPPLELLSHRAIWSLVAFAAILVVQGRLREVGATMTAGPRSVAIVLVAGAMISVNWFVFIWSVGVGRVTEASFGYYIFPLVAVLLGVALFGERLSRLHWAAVLLAGVAVVALGVGLGNPPWVSLILAVTFGIYGALKKISAAGPVVSVTAETLLLAPAAVGYLIYLAVSQGIGYDAFTLALLLFSGVLTAGPLVLFSYASKRIGLATVGVIQYLNPTLQFLCAAVIFGEPITVWHMIAFP
ncbi:MAG: EamA family transporter RarD, partial [Rhodobacteraceae bacterium]|nr:EamA family transporter RarD [Paracoccaceae bacterium]